jgi:hypothetical protein
VPNRSKVASRASGATGTPDIISAISSPVSHWRLSARLDLRYILRSATVQYDVLSGTVSTVWMSARRLMGLVGGLTLWSLSVCGFALCGGLTLGAEVGSPSIALHAFARDGERRPLHDSRWESWCPPFPFTPSPPAMRASHGFTVERLRSHLPARARSSAPFVSIHTLLELGAQ